MGTDAGDTNNKRYVYGITNINNNIDNKNAHTKACFSIYNIASAGAGNINNTNKKVANNTNNTGASQSSKVDKTNKGGLGKINKAGVSRVNKSEISQVDKSEIGETNNSRIDGANIKAGKKTSVGVIASTNNSINNDNKVIN